MVNRAVDATNLSLWLFDRSPVGTVLVEGEEKLVRYANVAFCALVGRSMEGLLGARFSEVMPWARSEGFVSLLDQVASSGEAQAGMWVERVPSRRSKVHWQYAVWPAGSRTPGTLLIQVSDATEQAQASLPDARLARQLREANERLLQASVQARELAEQAAGHARDLETIIEAVPDGIAVTNRHGDVVAANSALARLLGFVERKDALRPMREYQELLHVSTPGGPPVPPEQWATELLRKGTRARSPEAWIRARDGLERLVHASLAPLVDDQGEVAGAVAVLRDVTAERRWARQREALARVGQALSRQLDLEVVLQTVVEEARQVLGAGLVNLWLADWERQELRLVASRDLQPETIERLQRVSFASPLLAARAFRTGVLQAVEDVSQADVSLAEARAVAELEGVRSVLAVPLRAAGRPVGALTLGTHALRRFALAERETIAQVADLFGTAVENARLYQQSQQRAKALEEERRRREVFISAVAHELGNHMTPIRGYAQLLTRQPEPPAAVQQQGLHAIAREARSVSRLVFDLLDVCRIEARRFEVEPEAMDLAEVARAVVEAEQLTATKHRLILDGPDRLEGTWDRDRIVQVLTNLVSNAIKYSPLGGVVRVTLERGPGEATVSVADEGIGMDPDAIPMLFEPYSRLYQERRARGLGLGLFIARAIVESHRGRIWAESPGSGQGSTFSFTLPLGADRGTT